jgi:hypothetical protein
MEQILPGIHHWTAFRDTIGQRVHSYYVEPAGALIDPMEPEEGLEAFEGLAGRPRVVLLTNRHHYRHADRFAEAFGCPVLASAPGMHEFEGTRRQVTAFAFGDEVAPGITAVEVGAICPDETALHIAHGGGAVALADGVIRGRDGSLAFVPDGLMDDPPATKRGLREAFRRLADRDFDTLLMAHGDPWVGGGKAALEGFAGRSDSSL